MRSLQRSRRTIQTKVASTWAVVGLSRHLPRPTNTSNLTSGCIVEQDWPKKMCKYIWIQIQCTQMTWLLWCIVEPIKGANTSKYKYTQPQYWLHLSARLIQQICLTMAVIRRNLTILRSGPNANTNTNTNIKACICTSKGWSWYSVTDLGLGSLSSNLYLLYYKL